MSDRPGWFAERWRLGRDSSRDRGGRAWALAEIGCALLTLATLGWAVLVLLARPFVELPGWANGAALGLALSGAVGYGTNFIAVKMLFSPREPARTIPLRWIWRQGLIPAKRVEMAELLGEAVATKLLTPERASAALAELATEFLRDEAELDRAARSLDAALRRDLARALDAALPALLETVEGPVVAGAKPPRVRAEIARWLEAYLARPEDRRVVARLGVAFLRARTPLLVELTKRVIRRYQKTSGLRELGIGLGKRAGILEWDELEETLAEVLERKGGEEWMLAMVDAALEAAPSLLFEALDDAAIEDMARRFLAMARDSASASPLGERIVGALFEVREGATLWRRVWVEISPALTRWIEAGGLAPAFARFDVRGKVTEAALALDTAELEDMANRVGAVHLAAIQVLGYLLGLAAGVLLVAVSR